MANEGEHGGFEEVRESVEGHPMRSLLGYARPYWQRLTVGVLASLLARLSRLVPPVIVGVAIDRVIRAPGKPGLLADLGLITARTIPESATALRFALLERLVVIAAIAYAVRSATRFTSRYLLQSTAQKIQRDLRNDTYDHMQHLSMDFFADHQTGGMMSILNNDINRLERFLNTEIRQIIRVVATVGGIAAVMFYISPKLALVALAPVPFIGLASGKFLTWVEPKYKAIRETVARLNTRLENNIGGAPVIKTFNRHEFELDRVADQSEAYHDEKVAAIRMRRAFFSSLRLLTGVVFVALLYLGGRMVIGGALAVGSFATLFLLLRRLYSPMRRIGKTANKYQLAKSSAERVFGILGHDPTVTSPENPTPVGNVAGRVTFEEVRFSYDEDEILSGVSLDVSPGETVGLAGATGAGKSTLLKLIPRFYDPNEGAIRIDGTDVREFDLHELREEIGIVEQNPYLFSGTVKENIAYGDLTTLESESVDGGSADAEGTDADTDTTDDRIEEAARAAEAHEFITDLPHGYDTQIGERGVKLSGGQRQRVAIARALLNDPAIIVLDEATSDVDTETEELIQESLNRLCEDRTAFVIAHRLSTIEDADRIVVMDDGRIREEGSHDELLSADDAYADLWRSQSGDAPAATQTDD